RNAVHMILLPLRCFKDVRAARERTERYASTGSYVVSWIQVESRSDDRFVPWSPRNESPHSFVGPAFSIRLVIATRKGIFACWEPAWSTPSPAIAARLMRSYSAASSGCDRM